MKKIIFIEGMMCENCKKRVEAALKRQEGIEDVKVSLEEKKAEILLNKDIDNESLKELIEDLGYDVTKIE